MNSVDCNWRTFVENGDKSSFSIIYNACADDLYSYGVSLGFQKEMCKDAIQDTFYRLYISRKSLRPINNVTAYIFKSFKHRLIDLSRKNMREEPIDSATESFTIHVTVLDSIIDKEDAGMLKKKVSSLLNGLTAKQREVIYLRYTIGLGHKEIADILDIREESARKLLHRTMEKLRQQASEEDFRKGLGILFLLFAQQPFV